MKKKKEKEWNEWAGQREQMVSVKMSGGEWWVVGLGGSKHGPQKCRPFFFFFFTGGTSHTYFTAQLHNAIPTLPPLKNTKTINTKKQSQICINSCASKGISHAHIQIFDISILLFRLQYLVQLLRKRKRSEMRMTEWDTLRNWGEGLRLRWWTS